MPQHHYLQPTDRPAPSRTASIPVEASSLSHLSALADAPPLSRPDPESSYTRKGLLLWLVRVPDSQDIILTTLHPARGAPAATAADIASSLYYLHQPTHAPGSATLIRRSPGSGEQRNVAQFSRAAGRVTVDVLGAGYERLAAVAAPRPNPGARKPLPAVFTRVMQIEGAGFWERLRGRKSPPPSAAAADEPALRRHKKRDYVFACPWGTAGTVEFQDEAGGRFLKCKYYGAGAERSTLLSVAELKSGGGGHRRAKSATDMDDGSGRGKKGKLGMLIVHGPGQEVLDLVVAANMAACLGRWEGWGRERGAVGGA
ncbi:hypothetical protein EDC01DRAFT_785761 [Geopyxis carbonaria]|nr:hypothetical protein EDC01DRAFT_785761 [Geopyxis carbonaria]